MKNVNSAIIHSITIEDKTNSRTEEDYKNILEKVLNFIEANGFQIKYKNERDSFKPSISINYN